MNEQQIKRISKFLSLILRHNPETIQIKLDKNGWADVDKLIKKSKNKYRFNRDILNEVVATNNKKRFSFNDDETKIRANQGHSLKYINLEFENVKPPQFLYHGTVAKFMSSIKEKGLLKMNRQHVHLSHEIATAQNVGSRRGKPIILSISSGQMYEKGYEFYFSENDVWLTDNVPSEFIEFKNI